MALDSLKWRHASEFTHQPKHDLESLFYVILTLCTYVERPGHLRSPIPMANDPSICLNDWWSIADYHDLARSKAITLSSFTDCTLARLPSYWDDFHPVLEQLHAAIWPEKCVVLDQPNQATHEAFFRILDQARKTYEAKGEQPHLYAPVVTVVKQLGGSKRKPESGAIASEGAKRRKK